jgi:hypothetical protein
LDESNENTPPAKRILRGVLLKKTESATMGYIKYRCPAASAIGAAWLWNVARKRMKPRQGRQIGKMSLLTELEILGDGFLQRCLAYGDAENSPAIYGWVERHTK